MKQIARQTAVPLVCCNLVGGNDSLVFDGASSAFDARGRLVARGESFREDFWTIELPGGRGPVRKRDTDVARLTRALALALDYAEKCGLTAVLGPSGESIPPCGDPACGGARPDRVTGVAMPGPYSSGKPAGCPDPRGGWAAQIPSCRSSKSLPRPGARLRRGALPRPRASGPIRGAV